MLGTRTKQIYSYGKRNQRIVAVSENREMRAPSIFDDIEPLPRAPIASKMKKREHTVHAKSRTPSPKIVHLNRKKKHPSSTISPSAKFARLAELLDAETIKAIPKSKSDALISGKLAETPSRAPLVPFSLNTPGTPTLAGKLAGPKVLGTKGKPSKLKSFSPFVDVDITVLDDNGRTVRQERRVSRTDVQSNPVNEAVRKPLRRPSKARPALEEETQDDEEVFELKRLRRPAKRVVITVESDTEDEDVPPTAQRRSSNTPTPQEPIPTPAAVSQPLPSCSHMPGPSRLKVEVLVPPAPYTIKRTTLASIISAVPLSEPSHSQSHYLPPSPPLIRPRQLTPIRRHGGQNLFNPPFPPSPSLTSTDLDLSFDLEDLNIIDASTDLSASQIPDYLKPLLAECGQSACGPIEFSSFIETFPYDRVVQSAGGLPADLRFRKIGEASYSEVFGIGDVVLKVIPLRDESDGGTALSSAEDTDEDDSPAPTDAKDVLKEIIVTEAMGQVCDGFVKLLKTYVIRGKYPEVLLRLWDEYHANKGSESVRPDKFLVSQVYAIIVLPNGGPDLEAYKFVHPNKMGWRQACSIFWQVAKSLAHAEQLVSFEHRDLHLGQILVKDLPMAETLPLQARNQNVRSNSKPSRVYMDDPAHGVRATLIDLGLSRMDAGDGDGGEMIHWTPFEDEVFMGEGDYQFDVYRMMKMHNGGAWEEFQPLTNVMWLHYLAVKLMKAKRLRAPVAPRTSPTLDTAAFTERDCYDCLMDIEEWLRTCVAPFVPKAKGKGRKKAAASTVAPPSGPACAGEVVAYAVKKGWIQPVV